MSAQIKQVRIGREAVLKGLEDAILHMEGELDLQPDFAEIPQQDPKSIRDSLKLSQSQFAGRFGIPLATLKNWEQGRRSPDQPANVLLFLIERMPASVAKCLHQPRQRQDS